MSYRIRVTNLANDATTEFDIDEWRTEAQRKFLEYRSELELSKLSFEIELQEISNNSRNCGVIAMHRRELCQ